MKKDFNTAAPARDERKIRRREFYLILAIIPLIAVFTYIERKVPLVSGGAPVPANILVVGLVNINIILLLVLVYFVLRNAAKVFFENRRFAKRDLKTKLAAAFILLTIIPSFFLFWIVVGFINRSIDSWFAIGVEDSLRESIELARGYYEDTESKMLSGSHEIARRISEAGPKGIRGLLSDRIRSENFSTIEVYAPDGARVAYAISMNVNKNMVPDTQPDEVKRAMEHGGGGFIQTVEGGDIVRGISPIEGGDKRTAGAVVVSYYIPQNLKRKMNIIASAFEGYEQLKLLKNPVKTSYFTILLAITLVIVFFSIWIGRHLAREITTPIAALADGTHAVASGNLDYRINVDSDDEIGLLVKSFNRMTEDLKAGKNGLERANRALREINRELERKHHYIETVLSNIPAGVVSFDKGLRIVSFNRVAAEILGIEGERAGGLGDVLSPQAGSFLSGIIKDMEELDSSGMERQFKIQSKKGPITALVNLNVLKDESAENIGYVAVLDDLTHLLKTQRMAAWKEVAKRIAHEIKNPLTPIQLSAERLRRKYGGRPGADAEVFEECTKTIVNQVEELKTLVNEFSSFARMPASNPSPNDLNELVRETLSLYRPAHKNITFETALSALPTLEIDRDQMKRVLINLVDNASHAIEGEGAIRVETFYDAALKTARLEISDTGTGIPAEDKERLFEPYFSTRKSGTGLGLAIASNIVADHNGYIRVKDNIPRGTRFIIELPVGAEKA